MSAELSSTSLPVEALVARLEEHAALLSTNFEELVGTLQASLGDASDSTLDHLLVYAEAVDAVQVGPKGNSGRSHIIL